MYAAIKALKQLELIQEQNVINRESIAIKELREFEKIITEFKKLDKKIIEKNTGNIVFDTSEMEEFNLTEASSDKFKSKISRWHDFYKVNPEVFSEACDCCNKLEIIATALNKGTAKIEVIEDSISFAFCTFVESNPYIYVRNRNDSISLYKNTITIYKRFKPKVKTIAEQTEILKKEVDRILKK